MIKRNQEWKWRGADVKVLENLRAKIERKIKGFERMINRYEKTNEMLTRDMNEILDQSPYRGQDPKVLLRVLLSSV